MQTETLTKEPIAIVGVGCVLPDAPDVPTFWANLRAGKDSIREVPRSRWDPALFWSADKAAPDKTYAKIGAFVHDDNFAPLDYRLLPTAVQQIDQSQRWALSATRQAFLDAGYKTGLKADEAKTSPTGKPLRDFDRNRCAVILGNAMGGELMKLHTKRLYWPQLEAALRSDPHFTKLPAEEQKATLARAEQMFKGDTPPINEDSMPGTLSNVAAGRVANVFDLAGKNFTTDAACASSLAALDSAIDTLRKGEADMVVWGGTDRSMDVTPYVEFSKIGALSPDGSRPFDANANGFVMGEGCAVFLLRRLRDAERDGDTIYCIVRGIGGSSDGKGKGITAPNPAGQVKAVIRAYQDASIDPYSIDYLEAHGTSTPVGDPVELTSAEEAFKQVSKTTPRPASIAVGSVKSNMGHLKSAAGAAGMLKVALGMRHGLIPPSINVRNLNPRISWGTSAFKVQSQEGPWPRVEGRPRRAAVSSFGFGGTNFHVVVEEHVPGRIRVVDAATSTNPPATSTSQGTSMPDLAGFRAHMSTAAALEAEPLVLDARTAAQAVATLKSPTFAQSGQGPRLRDMLAPLTQAGLGADVRVATSLADVAEVAKKLEQAQKAALNPAQARLAFQQGIFMNQGKPQGKVAFLFPGQGTQYVNMLRDLAAKYEVVRNTFEEADRILLDELDGVRLTDILWPTPDTPEAQAASEKKLQLTEFTQPAVLAADVAILRLLRQWGIEPDVVAGHSLGEYGALVAAGVLTFGDALHAVAARGREMAHVEVPDLGKMASVSGDWKTVTEAIASVTEYVIPANKNCPSQTVIAGSSKGVDQAVALLQQKGMQAQYLPVSAAFHSAIVAPASKPLRKVLSRLDVKSPKVRVLSNVGTEPYQDDPEWIRDNLATQVASPVEWIGIIERMHAEGVRTFIEVGPKLALTNFVRDILKEKGDAVAIGSNHPKKGGIAHVNELFAFLGAWGFKPRLPALDDPAVYTKSFRDPMGAFRREPSQAAVQAGADVADLARQVAELRQIVVGLASGRAPTQPQMAQVPQTTPGASAQSVDGRSSGGPSAREQELERKLAAFGINLDDIGISGISVGLPGAKKDLFADDNFDRILRGENLIDSLSEAERQDIVDKNVVRLSKGGDGSAQFQLISDVSQVIHLAGKRGGFDVGAYGVEQELAQSLDRTFQYAIAAGLEALRDAGIPLQRTYLQTSTGGYLPKEWKLPEGMRDETGIVFASAFPGYDNLLRDVSRYLADKYEGKSRADLERLYQDLVDAAQDPATKGRLQELFDREFQKAGNLAASQDRYEFNRKFLFNVLSMGHSQLAQFIGARGPNTQVNAACASTTQAIGIAEDWIRTGRAKRVLVVGADDVTSDAMFEWIGAGFLASGAATTKADVREAALPFDRRRHGMIVGMGAVGLVVETIPETSRRGMRPIARLLATKVSNSAFHGSRLDVAHIAGEMRAMLADADRRYGVRADAIAGQTVFMSHETFTPARGGSASAEIAALRATFGQVANKVVVANTKGFTGHPQGAGVEDAIVLKCLQRGVLPPIANFKEPDPELGDLNLSKGGKYDIRYALRLAAGFGSQVAMTLTELVARESERVADPARYQAWLAEVSGLPGATTEVVHRTLRIVDQGAPQRKPTAAKPAAAPATPQVTQVPQMPPASSVPTGQSVAPASAASGADVLPRLIDLVAQKTGYPKELLDPALDMEADLGIDTVKQAELFGAIREAYGLPQEEGIQIKDYPTLQKVAGYVQSRLGGAPGTAVASSAAGSPVTPAVAGTTSTAARVVAAASPHPEATSTEGTPIVPSTSLADGEVLAKLIDLVAQKTGYPKELLDPNLDMESDLGIDTVKQAELFGAIREAYALPQEEGIQIKDYPTLAKVAGYVQSRLHPGGHARPSADASAPTAAQPQMAQAPQSTVPTAAASVPAKAAASAAGVDEASAIRKVTELVAAKTGYPVEMLEPDLDMEADLGIDTVKQAELFGEVRAAYGIPMVEGLLIKDYPTLRKVAGFVLQHTATSAAATSSGQAPGATTAGNAVATASPASGTSSGAATQATGPQIVRRVPMVRPQNLPEQANQVRRGPVLLLGEPDPHVESALGAEGFTPTTSVKEGEQPVGIVALATRPGPETDTTVRSLFDAAKALRAHMGKGTFVACLVRQDGSHGLHHVRDAGFAALVGLTKALKKEFPDAVAKAVDAHPECPDAARKLVAEVLRGGRRTEVSYGRDGARFVVEVAPQDLPAADPDVEQKGIIVSGGAQGITVELLAALAPQRPRLLLLGRTELPQEAEAWAKLDAAGWKAMEAELVAGMKERGEKVTPVTIKNALSPRQKSADVWRNLTRLQELGATVLYAPVDVTDAATVKQAIAWAKGQWGAVHGVIHAAGVEISKDLSSKDRAQFDMVYDVKVKGWDALMAATRDDRLEFLVAFGSVAGRFGNIGQVDYSAANEYLAKAVKLEAARRKCMTGTTIAWGPWGEVGMATKGSILQIMEATGVTPIPTAAGVAQFLRELAQPGIRECVVAGELGAIDADQQIVAKGWDLALAVANQVIAGKPERYRLLERIDEVVPDKHLAATVTVDQARDRALADHKVDGVPYFPGVFGIEAFTEAGSLLVAPDVRLLGLEDMRFASPLKQLKAQPVHARLDADVLGSQKGETRVRARLTTRFVGPDGKPHGEPRLHFEGTLRFGTLALAPKAQVPASTGELTRASIYPPFFHGPSFQVLDAAGPFAPEAIARFREPTERQFGAGAASFHAYPMLLEAMFQACGLATLQNEQRMSLPAGIQRLEVTHNGPLPADVRLRARPTGRDAQGNRLFDVDAVAADGHLLARMTGYAMVETGPAPSAAKPAPSGSGASGASTAPQHGANAALANGAAPAASPPAPVPAPAAHAALQEAVALPELAAVHFEAVRVASGPAEAEWFTDAERATHARFPVPKRADEWRAGRLAAKRAVCATHPGVAPRDVEVQGDENGKPQLTIAGTRSPLHLSLTHRAGMAVAALSPQPVGIDLETAEHRDQSFLETAFAVPELKVLLASADTATDAACMWAAKEAALKRAGVGLKADLRAHQVVADDAGGAVVEGPTGRFGIRFYQVDGKVLAVSAPELDPAGASTQASGASGTPRGG